MEMTDELLENDRAGVARSTAREQETRRYHDRDPEQDPHDGPRAGAVGRGLGWKTEGRVAQLLAQVVAPAVDWVRHAAAFDDVGGARAERISAPR